MRQSLTYLRVRAGRRGVYPGRPRNFDPEQAVAVAQRLFHAPGYDAVSVADLTGALGINPPSFYAAFGSKAGLFARILDRYTQSEGVPLSEILQPGRRVPNALGEVLQQAASRYGGDAEARGCLAIEGARCNDLDAGQAAVVLTSAAKDSIRQFVAATHPDAAERLADSVVTVMTGLSTMARAGHGPERLRNTAAIAAASIEQSLA